MLWIIADILDRIGIPMGLFLVLLPALWDVAWLGARDWQLWQIHSWGVICQLIGAIVIGVSWGIRKATR